MVIRLATTQECDTAGDGQEPTPQSDPGGIESVRAEALTGPQPARSPVSR
jgi:hypothetical protein